MARNVVDFTGENESGRGDRIRTYDPLVPNQMRYQAALLPDREKPPFPGVLGFVKDAARATICTLLGVIWT